VQSILLFVPRFSCWHCKGKTKAWQKCVSWHGVQAMHSIRSGRHSLSTQRNFRRKAMHSKQSGRQWFFWVETTERAQYEPNLSQNKWNGEAKVYKSMVWRHDLRRVQETHENSMYFRAAMYSCKSYHQVQLKEPLRTAAQLWKQLKPVFAQTWKYTMSLDVSPARFFLWDFALPRLISRQDLTKWSNILGLVVKQSLVQDIYTIYTS